MQNKVCMVFAFVIETLLRNHTHIDMALCYKGLKKLDLLVQRADDSVVEMFVNDLQDFDICVHSSIQL